MSTRIGVDVGGTFTDLVALVDGRVITAKVPSTTEQSEGVLGCVGAAGLDPGAVDAFAHGTTVATNALLERKGARTALVTTAGFRDVIEIGRQNRPSLYDLTKDRPEPLVPRELRYTLTERMGPDGELVPVDEDALGAVIDELESSDAEAIAVCFLFGYLHPDHERTVGAALRAALPDAHVSLSSEVLPEFREYERFATSVANAYLGPRLASYLTKLSDRATGAGLPEPLVMQSSGGVIPARAAGAAACVLSGPAAGALGAAHVARASGFADVLTLDMGGTSTDVAPVIGGAIATTTETTIGGVPIKLPAVDVHTVGAGGGSVAWIDAGGALRVGPRSAGADPGPAAYGRGGTEPTVTDADLVLGYLDDRAVLGGEIALDRDLAERAVATLDMATEEATLGIARVAEAEMAKALRVISVEQGLDPRDFALVAFGGAGPMHACALAEELQMRTVLVPKASGVLSALGLAIADLRRDYVAPVHEDMAAALTAMEQAAAADLDRPRTVRRADLRYRGQSFELTVDADNLDALEERFHAAHEQRYGYRMEDQPVEVVAARLVATVPADAPEITEGSNGGNGLPTSRRVNFDGAWTDAPVWSRPDLGPGSKLDGPGVVEFAEATCVIRPGWGGRVDDTGTLVLERP